MELARKIKRQHCCYAYSWEGLEYIGFMLEKQELEFFIYVLGGVLGIGWIIDIVRIATGSFRDEFDLLLQ